MRVPIAVAAATSVLTLAACGSDAVQAEVTEGLTPVEVPTEE